MADHHSFRSRFHVLVLFLLSFFGVTSALALPEPLANSPRAVPSLKTGAWLVSYTPASGSPFDGYLRITNDNNQLFISGDLYNRTTAPKPADGIPVLPRAAYYTFFRGTKLSGSTSALVLDIEFFRLLGRGTVNNYTIWDSTPVNGGHTISLQTASAPSGFPSGAPYYTGTVNTKAGAAAGTFTMGWINQYVRKFTLEIGTVENVPYPEQSKDGTYTWAKTFNAAHYDIHVEKGRTDIPEPNAEGRFSNEQAHAAVLANRKPTDFDKEWRIFLLVARLLDFADRGAMIDTGTAYNGIPREGTAVSADWIIGTTGQNGAPDGDDWGPSTGQKFSTQYDSFFRTCMHEVGHFWDLGHPTDFDFVDTLMTDTSSYVEAGMNGVTEKKWPDNMDVESFNFRASDVFLMDHLSDAHVRPGWMPWGAPVSTTVPKQPENLNA